LALLINFKLSQALYSRYLRATKSLNPHHSSILGDWLFI